MNKQKRLRALAKVLKQHLSQSGRPLSAVSDRVDVTYTSVKRWFDGEQAPTLERVEEIIEILSIPPAAQNELRELALRAGANDPGLELAEFVTRRVILDASGVPPGTMEVVYIPIVESALAADITDWIEGGILQEWQGGVVPLPKRDIEDEPRAFALFIEGESMEPRFKARDVVVAAPSRKPEAGKPAVVALHIDEEEMVILCKLWQPVYKGKHLAHIILASINPDYADQRVLANCVEWAYPVFRAVTKI